LAAPTFARYQVGASAGRQVEPDEVAELATRFQEIDGVGSAERMGPNDVEVPVTLDPEMLDLLGLSVGKLLEMTDLAGLSRPDGQDDDPMELRILTEAGTDPDVLMQRVLAWREDGRPIYLFQAAGPLGPIPPAERPAAVDLTVRLDGADRAYLEQNVLPVLREAAAEADPAGVEDLCRDGTARLRLRFDQDVDLQDRRLAVAAAVSRRIDRLPRAAGMAQVTRAEPGPDNRIHVRLAAGADRQKVQDALDQATRAFLDNHNPEDPQAPKLLVRRLEPASDEIAETLPDRPAR
jgi:multidrug efflux pump subunit AcrB